MIIKTGIIPGSDSSTSAYRPVRIPGATSVRGDCKYLYRAVNKTGKTIAKRLPRSVTPRSSSAAMVNAKR
ncbi:hypothetical protein LMG28727_07109 [Paraburkholderia kirstenboschensis]|nr:hypothetical protein LMG28727_07109 [Paraburkholderia kirstenboschensis]